MKKGLTIFAIILFCFALNGALSENFLPSLTDVYGVPMPSLGDVLNRYPDAESKTKDGSTRQNWNNVKETDFESFSKYLGTIGASLVQYSMENGIFDAVIEKDNRTFSFKYDQQKETATVIYPVGTYDERCTVAESQYKHAKQLCDAGSVKDAYALFLQIVDYKDVSDILASNKKIKEYLSKYGIKKELTFGEYHSEPIQWIIIAENGSMRKLMSLKAIDAMEFGKLPWDQSPVRSFLINDMFYEAFSENEQKAIVPDGETGDIISIVSKEEARWAIDNNYIASHTSYASSRKIRMGRKYCWCGTRDMRSDGVYIYTCDTVMYAYPDGNTKGNTNCIGIRPTIWIDVSELQ